VDEQVRRRGRLGQQAAAERQDAFDVLGLRQDQAGRFVDDVVEAHLQLLVLAKRAERLGYGIVGVEYGQDMAGAGAAMPGQLLDAADGDAEGGRCAAHGVPVRLSMAPPCDGAAETARACPSQQGPRLASP